MSAPKKPVSMCCVSIGYHHYLLPADKGMKLVELLQSAFETDKDYHDRGYTYQIGEQPCVELTLVKPAQIRSPVSDTNDKGQRLLT